MAMGLWRVCDAAAHLFIEHLTLVDTFMPRLPCFSLLNTDHPVFAKTVSFVLMWYLEGASINLTGNLERGPCGRVCLDQRCRHSRKILACLMAAPPTPNLLRPLLSAAFQKWKMPQSLSFLCVPPLPAHFLFFHLFHLPCSLLPSPKSSLRLLIRPSSP